MSDISDEHKGTEVLHNQIEVLRKTVSEEQTKVMNAHLKLAQAEEEAKKWKMRAEHYEQILIDNGLLDQNKDED